MPAKRKVSYIVIAGGGSIGAHLVKMLEASGGKDIAVIEKDRRICENLSSSINALVICGDAGDKKTLERAKIQMADVFVAATESDNENIVACQFAKYSYKVPLVFARVENMERAQMMRGMHIDLIVSPAHVASAVFENAIALPGATSILMSETTTRAVEILVPDDSKAAGKNIKDLPLPPECVIAAVHREGKLIIPRDDTVIKPCDTVAVIGEEDAIRKVMDILMDRTT